MASLTAAQRERIERSKKSAAGADRVSGGQQQQIRKLTQELAAAEERVWAICKEAVSILYLHDYR